MASASAYLPADCQALGRGIAATQSGRGQKAKNGKAKDPHRPNTVSSALASRVPVYGYSALGLGACQAHLDGEMDSADCPVCEFDARNLHTHMSAAERERRLVREEEQTQPAEHSDQTGTATHHFIGRRTERTGA